MAAARQQRPRLRLASQRVWIAGVALASLAIGSPVTQQSEEAALREDDQCLSGEAGCAVDALQRRGVRSAVGVEDSAESRSSRRRGARNQAVDLTVDQERDLVSQIDLIGKNVTHMRWKLYYFGLDIKSTQDILTQKENASVGVNGTKVKWTAHEHSWLPSFSSLQTESASSPSSTVESQVSSGPLTEVRVDEDLDEPMQAASLLQSGRRRRDSLADVPPRTRRTQQYMTTTQRRLDSVWKSLTLVERRITLLHNYMGSHRRLVHGRAVLTQESADLETALAAVGDDETLAAVSSHESSVTSSRRRSSSDLEFDEFELEWGSNPEGVILKQIKSAENQTESIWAYMGKRGRQMEACKRRVQMYEAAVDEENPLFDWKDEDEDSTEQGEMDAGSESKAASSKTKLLNQTEPLENKEESLTENSSTSLKKVSRSGSA